MSGRRTLDAGPIAAAVQAAQGDRTLTELFAEQPAARRAFDRARRCGAITPAAVLQLCDVVRRHPDELYPGLDWDLAATGAPAQAGPRPRRRSTPAPVDAYQAVWDAMARTADAERIWTGDLPGLVAAVADVEAPRALARGLLTQGWVERVAETGGRRRLPARPLIEAVRTAAGDRPLAELLGAWTPAWRTFYRVRAAGTASPYAVRQLCALAGRQPEELYPQVGWAAAPRSRRPGPVRPARSRYRLVRRPEVDRLPCDRPGCDGTVPSHTAAGRRYARRSRRVYCTDACEWLVQRAARARVADELRRAAGLPATGSHQLTLREMRALGHHIGRRRVA